MVVRLCLVRVRREFARSEVKEDWTVLVSRKKHLKKYMQKMQSGFLEGSERDGFYTKRSSDMCG